MSMVPPLAPVPPPADYYKRTRRRWLVYVWWDGLPEYHEAVGLTERTVQRWPAWWGSLVGLVLGVLWRLL